MGTFLVDAEGSATRRMKGIGAALRPSWRAWAAQKSSVATPPSGCPLGDGQSFVVEGGEGSLDGVGVGAALDGEVADGGDLLAELPRAVGDTGAGAAWPAGSDGAGVITCASTRPSCLAVLIH